MSSDREAARRREAARLDAEILEAIGRGWDDPLSDEAFDRLARDVFAHQLRFNPVYRQFCAFHGVAAAADVETWRSIPPVPTGAFKVGRWAAFPESEERVAFRTSGTTTAARGVHRFETLALYNAAIVSSARRWLLPDRERIRCLFLSPDPRSAPDSSLVHMLAVFREAFGDSGSAFLAEAGDRAVTERLAGALDRSAAERVPVLLAGAALAFHHALPRDDRRAWDLAPGSRAMVTGGFKGVRAAADPAELAVRVETRTGIPRALQVAEYGMTELSTQYYDGVLRATLRGESVDAVARGFVVPPWARVRVVEPLTGAELAPGETGSIVHVDLANRGSAVALQTSDLGTRTGPVTFELRGREPDAEARGCSLAADLWLS